jgi:hypothetical protein
MTTVDKNAKKEVITGKENELKMELTKSSVSTYGNPREK